MSWGVKILKRIIWELQICPFWIPALILVLHEFICRPCFDCSKVSEGIGSIVSACPIILIASANSSVPFLYCGPVSISFKASPASISCQPPPFIPPPHHRSSPDKFVRVFFCINCVVVIRTGLKSYCKFMARISLTLCSVFIYHFNPSPPKFIFNVLST